MLALYALYALPFAIRLTLSPGAAWGDVVVSLLPIAVVFPSSYAMRCLGQDHEREHVVRHAFYSLAFSVSIGTSVRWDYLSSHWRECLPLILYLIVGGLTLWWFVLSHAVENRLLPWMRTHQGDVAVLPLTLVAIATFARDIPDEAFRFSRAVIFFVPVVVAWATIFFISYHDFARGRVTTFHQAGFDFHARSALLIASAHLTLLECRSPATVFQFFPLTAALLCQVTHLHTEAPAMRPWWRTSVLATSLASGGAVGSVLVARFGWHAFGAVCVGTPILALTLPTLAGVRWVLPGCAYLSLGLVAYIVALSESGIRDVGSLAVADVFAVLATSLWACWIVETLSRPVWTPTPPASLPELPEGAPRPQDRAPPWAPSRIARLHIGCWFGNEYTEDTPDVVLRRHPVDPRCPARFRGVWWMDGNTFPVDLVVVHDARWNEDGTSALRYDADGITHDASLFGVLIWMWTACKRARIDVVDDRWIRTSAYYLPVLRLLFVTYWIRMVNDDEMERVVFSATGRVVWRYTLRRIVRADGSRTAAHAAFVRHCAGRRYIGGG